MNQRIDLPELLDARTAARLLGVRLPTLYAYASRGKVRSMPLEAGGRRERRYVRDDVLALKARSDARAGHGPVAAGALRWGEPVLESAITRIDPLAGPVYRGHAAVSLADEDVGFDSVAELLWTGALPSGPESSTGRTAGAPFRTPPWSALQRLAPREASPLSLLSIAVPVVGAADPHRHAAPLGAELSRARQLLRTMAALLALPRGPSEVMRAWSESTVCAAAARALGVRGEAQRRAVNAALVLSADHELNASTFATRIAAATGADLYACVSVGLGTLSGPRHGGACDRVEALLEEVREPAAASRILQERHRRGEEVPGFGHPLYPQGDPRAGHLLQRAARVAPADRGVRTLLALASAMKRAEREPPTLDLGLVAVARAVKLRPGEAAALFALGRAAGWMAHVFEQRSSPELFRPRARYVGPDPVRATAVADSTTSARHRPTARETR